MSDMEILKEAQAAAELVLANDPEFSGKSLKPLRDEFLRMFEKLGGILN